MKEAADSMLQGFHSGQEDFLLDNEVKDDVPETKKKEIYQSLKRQAKRGVNCRLCRLTNKQKEW